MRRTWLPTSTPRWRRSWRATEQQATRMAVSRALARSMTGRRTGPRGGRSKPCLCPPARSACPGRGSVTGATPSPVPSTAIVSGQPARSRRCAAFSSRSATGLPIVRPKRTPARISTRSASTFARPPRPAPSQRLARCASTSAAVSGTPAGIPSTMPTSAAPCDSPAVRNRIIRVRIWDFGLRIEDVPRQIRNPKSAIRNPLVHVGRLEVVERREPVLAADAEEGGGADLGEGGHRRARLLGRAHGALLDPRHDGAGGEAVDVGGTPAHDGLDEGAAGDAEGAALGGGEVAEADAPVLRLEQRGVGRGLRRRRLGGLALVAKVVEPLREDGVVAADEGGAEAEALAAAPDLERHVVAGVVERDAALELV